MASTVPPCGRGSVQPLWDSTKGKYVEVECPHASRVERLQMHHVYAINASPRRQHHHPSALRNRVPILRALMEYLPGGESLVGDAAEISAGTGALLELLAPAFPNITWTPTEFIPPQRITSTDTQWARWGKIGRGAQDLTTIDAHLSHFPNCERALAFDLRSDPWPAPLRSLDLIICANLLHITPWVCAEQLFDGASRALRPGGQFILYGAFTVDGEFIGESNRAFDAFCRQTRGYGLKEFRDLERLAEDVGLACLTPRDMPANNLLLRFVKAERGPLQKMLSWAGVEELVL